MVSIYYKCPSCDVFHFKKNTEDTSYFINHLKEKHDITEDINQYEVMNICPLTGSNAIPGRGKFWKYIVNKGLDPDNLDYECMNNLDEVNIDNKNKLMGPGSFTYLWTHYFKGKMNKKPLENLIGFITIELLIILVKVYMEEMDPKEYMDSEIKVDEKVEEKEEEKVEEEEEEKVEEKVEEEVEEKVEEKVEVEEKSNDEENTNVEDITFNSMRYLGNKFKHLEFIHNTINKLLTKDNIRIYDAFSGTGCVSRYLNNHNYEVISSDMLDFSFKLSYSRNSIIREDLCFTMINKTLNQVITYLNQQKSKGFVYLNYSPNPSLNYERKYFTNDNAEIIDGIRSKIEEWYESKMITDKEYIFLISLLIESVSLYSNIPGTYGAFNNTWDSRALKVFKLENKLVDNLLSNKVGKTFHNNNKDIISNIDCDILYLDPPYNERDYAVYYHVLETISKYDNPKLKDNKTATKHSVGKSLWCCKDKCIDEFKYLIENTRANIIVLSYNNEGHMKHNEIKDICEIYGKYTYYKKLTKRFKCSKNNENIEVYEYLHVLEKTNMTFINKIYNTCCISGMKDLPEKSVDIICTDLPYGLTECKWDTPINLDDLWGEYKRILKPFGTIILFGQQPFTSRLVSSNYDMFKQSLVWKKSKPGGFAQAPYKILCEHEDILIFSYGKTASNAKNPMTYNPQGTKKCNKLMKGKTGNTEHRKGRKIQKDYVQNVENYPRSILQFNNEGKVVHPTQKPLELLKYLIKTYSNEGDIVLDSCIGSGTTIIAAIETKRNYIGYENNKKYYDISINRINRINDL